MRLGVHDNRLGHVEVGGGIDIHVAVAVSVDHVGNRRVFSDRRDQRRTAAGNQHVDQAVKLHELARGLVARVLDEQQRVGVEAGPFERLAQKGNDRDVGAQRSRRPTQEGGITRLQAQTKRVARDIRAVFIDDRHHSERYPNLLDYEPVGPTPTRHDLADGIGQRGHLPQPGRHRLDATGIEAKPVDNCGARTGVDGCGHVGGIGREHCVGTGLEPIGGRKQRSVFDRRVEQAN